MALPGEASNEALSMQCPHCRGETSETDESCGACGMRIAIICTKCRTPNAPNARFCNFCGTGLERSEASAERKFATVLFADIVGSTAMISSLDLEAALTYLPPAIDRMSAAVRQNKGTVLRTMGDGVLALFGVPRAQENHALQACQAALAMRRSLDENNMVVRVGIHSGEVISGLTIEETKEAGAYGAAIHLASRLEHMATPGTICMTEVTHKLVRPYCDAILLGMREAKGFSEPVGVYQLLGLKPAETSESFRTSELSPLRGRTAERARLDASLERARRGEGNCIAITAPPGVGKSRLCFEFAERCRADGVPVIEARASPYDYSGALQSLLEFLRAFFQIQPKDDVEMTRMRIATRIAVLDVVLEDEIPILSEFLGVGAKSPSQQADPKVRQARLVKAVGNLIRAGGRKHSVFIVEDLHWFDEASRDFLAALVEAVAGTHILLVLTYRSVYRAPWPASATFSEISLAELGPEDAEALVAGLVGTDSAVLPVARQIAERSGGNPFFAEELVRSLIDRGALVGRPGALTLGSSGAETLPATVQSVIGERIDRLRDTDKAILQFGATIGREFPLPVLEQVAGIERSELDPVLDRLCEADLIRKEVRRHGSEGFAFRHPLIQEVAYAMQLKARRAAQHALVAKAIERFHHNRLDQYADLVSHHFEAAGEFSTAATYAVRAALWIGTTHARQALNLWRKVLALLEHEPRSSSTDVLRIMAGGQIVAFGWREGMSVAEAAPYAEAALALARETGNRAGEILLIASYGRIIAASGSADDYVEHVERADALAAESLSQRTLIRAILCQAYSYAGRLRDAAAAARAVLDGIADIDRFHRQLLGFSVERWVASLAARIQMRMGEFDAARTALESLIASEAEHPDPAVQFIPHLALVELAWLTGDAATAGRHALRVGEIAKAADNTYVAVYAGACEGIAAALAGNNDGAADRLQAAVDMARHARVGLEYEPDMLANLAEALRRAGMIDAAGDVARQAITIAQARAARLAECRATITLAETLLPAPDAPPSSERDALLRHAADLIDVSGAAGYASLLDAAEQRGKKQPIPAGGPEA